MTQTPNYDLNMFDSDDDLEQNSRLGLNDNADKIDTALKGLQDDVDGLSSPPAADVTYDNTASGLTATDVQAAIDEELDKIDILSNSLSNLIQKASVSVPYNCPANGQYSFKFTDKITIPDGYTFLGIVGWAANDYRVHVSNINDINSTYSVQLGNSSSTAISSNITIYYLIIKSDFVS